MVLQLFGRLHPLLVHFPVAILILAFLLEVASRLRQFKKLKRAVGPVLLIGAVTSLLSLASGLALSREGGYDEALLSIHRNLGIATTVVAFSSYLMLQLDLVVGKGLRKRLRILLLIPVVVLVSLTGHFGGSLTHGEDFLTGVLTNPPEAQSTIVPLMPVASPNEAVMYSDVIRPILETRCYSCHSSLKQKGQLRMDEIDLMMRGGKHGLVLTRATPDSSSLYRRLLLPIEDKKHMPPGEKPQMSSAEIDLIHSWIADGFSFDKKVSAYDDKERILEFMATLRAMRHQKKSMVPEDDVAAASVQVIDKLTQRGILVMPVAFGSNYLTASFVNARSAGDQDIDLLASLNKQLIWLNLEHTAVSDNGMKALARMDGLRVLYLNNTGVGDEGIRNLRGLRELSYLNLVGTNITDSVLNVLAEFKSLENVFVFNTKISSVGMRRFMSKHQIPRIDTGHYQLPVLATDTLVYRRKV